MRFYGMNYLIDINGSSEPLQKNVIASPRPYIATKNMYYTDRKNPTEQTYSLATQDQNNNSSPYFPLAICIFSNEIGMFQESKQRPF